MIINFINLLSSNMKLISTNVTSEWLSLMKLLRLKELQLKSRSSRLTEKKRMRYRKYVMSSFNSNRSLTELKLLTLRWLWSLNNSQLYGTSMMIWMLNGWLWNKPILNLRGLFHLKLKRISNYPRRVNLWNRKMRFWFRKSPLIVKISTKLFNLFRKKETP